MKDLLYVLLVVFGVAMGVYMSIMYTDAKVREDNAEIVTKVEAMMSGIDSLNKKIDTLSLGNTYNIDVLNGKINSIKNKVEFIESEIRELNKDIDAFD